MILSIIFSYQIQLYGLHKNKYSDKISKQVESSKNLCAWSSLVSFQYYKIRIAHIIICNSVLPESIGLYSSCNRANSTGSFCDLATAPSGMVNDNPYSLLSNRQPVDVTVASFIHK